MGCKIAVDMFHLKKEDLIDDLDGILTIADFIAEPMRMEHKCSLFNGSISIGLRK